MTSDGSQRTVVSERFRLEVVTITTIVYLIAGILLALPTLFLAFGVQAAGSDLGWWRGDPNSNDGEGSWGIGVGLAAFAIVLTATAFVTRATLRRYPIRPRVPVVAGTLVVLILAALCCAWTILSAV